MPAPIYNSTRKMKLGQEKDLKTKESNELYNQQMKLLSEEADFDKIMEVRAKRNNVLLDIERIQSRIDNIGKYTGLEEQSIPNYKNNN